MIDETDLAVLDALHLSPRVPFERLGPALGMAPTTAARRWQRLCDDGRGWVSPVLGPGAGMHAAVLEAECAPGRTTEVARALAGWRQVFSVHVTTGTFGLYALVCAPDRGALSRLLLDELSGVDGLLRTRTTDATDLFTGVRWRPGALAAAQDAGIRLAKPAPLHSVDAGPVGTEFDRSLFRSLQENGRMGARELGARVGRSEHAVRRRLSVLQRRRWLSFGADFGRAGAGWATHAVLLLRVPDEQAAAMRDELWSWPQTRLCSRLVGAANLFVTAQVRGGAELDALLAALPVRLPGAQVLDRRVVLRPVKAWGRLLDEEGRAVDAVPVDPWALPQLG